MPTSQPSSKPSSAPLPNFQLVKYGNQVSVKNPNNYNSAYGISTDCYSGNLYVADTLNNRILQIIPNNGQVLLYGQNTSNLSPSTLSSPYGVAVSPTVGPPIVYVADTNNNRVLKIAAANGIVTTYGIPSSPAGFKNPRGLVVGSSGILFVAGIVFIY
jgi:DNA-binding beta-propeller fold protein YncE